MTRQAKQQRLVISLSTRRWTAYMAAAAASTFAGAGSSEAEIHYSGNLSLELTGDAVASLPLNGGASLVFQNIYQSTAEQTFILLLKGAISGSARGLGPPYIYLSNLSPVKNVSAGTFYSVAGNPNHGVLIQSSLYGPFSPFFGPVRGFVGFRFDVGNGTQYGWARIYTKLDRHDRVHDLIKDYAWGDPGDTIFTGQTHSFQSANASAVPGSLGLLAFGAQGLDAWRTQGRENSEK
jgi:hypothetical protein